MGCSWKSKDSCFVISVSRKTQRRFEEGLFFRRPVRRCGPCSPRRAAGRPRCCFGRYPVPQLRRSRRRPKICGHPPADRTTGSRRSGPPCCNRRHTASRPWYLWQGVEKLVRKQIRRGEILNRNVLSDGWKLPGLVIARQGRKHTGCGVIPVGRAWMRRPGRSRVSGSAPGEMEIGVGLRKRNRRVRREEGKALPAWVGQRSQWAGGY